MVRGHLTRGMLAGLAAGVVAFLLAYLLGESPLRAGIAYEEAGSAGGPGIVSRGVQSTLGLGTVSLLLGVALGGLFGLAFAAAQGRLGRLSARATAMVVALAAFLGTYALPQMKYPSNPPGINSGGTIGARTASYMIMMLIALVAVVGVVWLARRGADRLGSWNAAIAAILGGLAVLVVVGSVLPTIDETPPDFPATVLWDFRVASFALQAAMWATIGLVFGALTERDLTTPARAERHRGATR